MKGYCKTTKMTADGYTVNIYRREGEEPLPNPKEMTFSDYAMWIRAHGSSRGFILVKKKGTDDAYYGLGLECVSRSGRKVFPKTTYRDWLMYRDGKVTGNAIHGNMLDACITYALVEDRGLEALFSDNDRKDIDDDGTFVCSFTFLRRCLGQKTILKKILEGKITNRRDLVKAYMKSAFNMAPSQYSVLERYMDKSTYSVPIADIRDFTTDINAALLLLLDGDRETQSLFRDLIGDAIDLDKKINPKWSIKRMRQEHQDNIKVILERQLDAESDKSIYLESLDITFRGYRFQAIDNPRRALLESRTMHNCVFYNYWQKAAQRKYILFHMSSGTEDMSLGFHIETQGGQPQVRFDQIHTIHNGMATKAATDAAHAFAEEYRKDILLTVSELNASGESGEKCSQESFGDAFAA